MANEFNIKNGFITSGTSYVYNRLYTSGLTLTSIVSGTGLNSNILIRNQTTGDVEFSTFNSLSNIENYVTVGLSGSSTDFNSVKAAVDSITGATPNSTWEVRVYP